MAMLRKHLYRTLLKLGSKFDQNPRMKAFIFTGDARFPEYDEQERDMDQVILMEDVDRAMKEVVEFVCAPGIFYKPETSLKDVVRSSFRGPPPKDLDEHARNQLGFMAIRLLYNCEKLATELTYKGSSASQMTPSIGGVEAVKAHTAAEPIMSMPLAHPTSELAANMTGDYFQETNELKAGVLLVSHPLRVQYPFNNAVLLLTHVSEDTSAGILLNKEFEGNFKSLLQKLERIRYGHYLKPFYDMPCFIGGDGEFETHLNFCILHQQDSLAHLSLKIPLSDAINIGTLLPAADASTEMAVAAGAHAETPKIEAAETESANYVYISYDFASIGKELLSGNVSKADLKIVQGISYWTDGELQEEVTQHKFFPVRSSAANHIVLTSSAPAEQADEEAGLAHWKDRSVWFSGQHAWAKLLFHMGGEYRDLARIDRIASAEKGPLYVSILRNMLGYGQRPAQHSDYTGDEDMEMDSDFEDEIMSHIEEVVSLVDDDGNITGELLITKPPADPDDEHNEFDDSDNDDSDDDLR